MYSEYTTIYTRTPRSFLFAIIANVGPDGTTRPLAVAYRQHHDEYNTYTLYPRVRHMVADTLALIDNLSDPANRAQLEAETGLANDWYRQSLGDELPTHERPSVPDTEQPPYMPIVDSTGLPLSTVFRVDCLEYGLVVLDISDLDRVTYGIAAFPTCYMATVPCEDENIDWDPVEDEQPDQVDLVLASPRPRVLLSIGQWVRKYCEWLSVEEAPRILELEERPVATATTLDSDIWPPGLDDLPRSVVEMGASGTSSVTMADEPRHTIPIGTIRTTGTGG
ncbi:uncharacterized protein N7529_001339 [Penicillium soppii]|uniref:uncharacterized protein n=1 Tax=Penicillium soppii TaxID=69789 RepID=UPI0025475354|nr:uncharacterized protein N7529_001339 [Penicillium soppii]KAJ5882667.1 hypothetical protein N7529_001339 [Penicillium soppii]